MKQKGMLFSLFLGFAIACLASGSPSLAGDHAAKGAPNPAVSGLAADGRLQISAQDRCPVCGMFPAKLPKSAAGMQLSDGRSFYFCSNGCLLRSWRRSADYLGVNPDRIIAMVVQDYFSGTPLDARKAFWIAGSDVIGPMGPALVALSGPRDVEAFKQRHGGRHMFQLANLNDELWRELFPSRK